MKSIHKTKKKNVLVLNREQDTHLHILTDLEEQSNQVLSVAEKTAENIEPYYSNLVLEKQTDELNAEVIGIIDSYKRASNNLLKTYLKTSDISDELNARWKDLKKSRKKTVIPAAPANALIDLEEYSANHFAKGLNIYKLLLIGYIGSFVGVIIEVFWCLIRKGYIESRSGLVYGPFNLLYGVGAIALTVALFRYRNRSGWLSFLGGMLVGSVVEYLCSWGQEFFLGSRSWDYSNSAFNINGRICLLYSVIWGVLGIFWVKNIYPRMAKLILKIPNRIGKTITWVILAFFIINSLVSAISVYRWSQRAKDIKASNVVWEFVDNRFPDERMKKIFANMSFD